MRASRRGYRPHPEKIRLGVCIDAGAQSAFSGQRWHGIHDLGDGLRLMIEGFAQQEHLRLLLDIEPLQSEGGTDACFYGLAHSWPLFETTSHCISFPAPTFLCGDPAQTADWLMMEPAIHGATILKINRHEAALLGITMIWGTTFLIIQIAMQYSGPLFFVGLRFLTAGLISAVLFRRALVGMTRQDLAAGLLIGGFLFAGYGLQTYGLQSISSSQSAFITALYVPAVPLLQWLIWRRAPRFMNLVGVALAFIGLVLLAGPEGASLNMSTGEWATLVGALAVAVEIVLIGYFAGKVNLRRVTTLQLLVAGLLGWLLMPVAGESIPPFSWVWLLAAVGLGLASCLIQLTMNWAQKEVPPTRATLIYASEPVWAGILGRIAGDRLPGLALLGGVFIVAGVIASELKLRRKPRGSRPD